MKRNAHPLAVAAAAVLASAACGVGEAPGSDASPTEAEASTSQEASPTASPSPTEEPLEALDGTDYESCYDGDCEVLVSEDTTIAIDPGLGIDTMTITGFDQFTPEGGGTAIDRVMFEATGGGGYLSMTLPADGRGQLQGTLLVTAIAVGDGEAVLLLEPVE